MSIDIQKQIKENSQDVHGYFADLTKFSAEMGKKEKRREMLRAQGGDSGKSGPATFAPPVRGSDPGGKEKSGSKAVASTAEVAPTHRDKQSMPQYYQNWDHFDADEEVEQLDTAELEKQRFEQLDKDAQRDGEADERALKYGLDGDRARTSKAKPRVKVKIRGGNRRASPVDLAAPKKEQANQYFADGRYRDAIATYTAGLDYLEKYEPREETTANDSQDKENEGGNDNEAEQTVGKSGDCVGEDADAIALKVSLFANRAAAALKLEAWREAAEDCTETLRFDPHHHKAILRRGFALAKLKRWSAAARDLATATKNDPNDKKAGAEFQMALRFLADQAKAVRAHAKCQMCDPNRAPTMPLRRLKVSARRASDGPLDTYDWEPASTSSSKTSKASTTAPQDKESSTSSALSPAPAPVATVRKPYVPRSVRMRGPQQPSSASKPSVAGERGTASLGPSSAPMSFYAFEAQWTRLRSKPKERAALLRKIGTAAMPALFRESLDAEIVAQIAEALRLDLADEESLDRSSDVAFATAALAALVQTPRFDLSLRGLACNERDVCLEVLATLREEAVARNASSSELAALSEIDCAFEPPAALGVDEMD